MATIRTAIQIQDNLSQAFRAMNVAMQSTINSFEHLERASGNAIDRSAIELARRELARAESAFNDIETQIREADQQQDRFNRTIREGTSAANAMLSKLLAIVGTYMSLHAVGDVIRISDEVTDLKARVQLLVDEMPLLPTQTLPVDVNLEGMSGIEAAQQMIFDAAQRALASVKDTSALVSRIGSNAGDAFGSISEVVAFAELVQKQFGIAGATATEASNATIQLSQALASGVLRGEELNSIFEQAPNIIRTIADYLEVDIGQIRAMAKEGLLTADVIKNAMFTAADDINDKFNSMPTTWSQIWTVFKNEAQRAFEGVLTGINDVANSDRFKQFFADARQSLYALAAIVVAIFSFMTDMGAFVYDNWSLIAPVMGTATAAVLIYVAALTAMKLAKMATVAWAYISSTATMIYAAAMGTGTGATWAMVAATLGLNAALVANPIFWVIMAIVLLIGVIYIAVGAINHFAGTSISATGIVAGAFMVLVSFIYNKIAFLWNAFAAIAEFFVNVWNHPMYAVKKLFYDLASNVLDQAMAMTSGWDAFATSFVNAIISAVNGAIKAWNWFVDMLPDEVASTIGISHGSEFAQRTSVTSDLSGVKNALGDWLGESPQGTWEAPKMDMKSLGAAWDTGYNWGSNLFSGGKDSMGASTSWEDIANGINMPDSGLGAGKGEDSPAAKQTAGNTAKMAKSMEGSANELKYLRDLAEREAINRYTTAEVKLEMKNENHIHHDTDIDGLIDRMGEQAEELVYTLAEGGDYDDV